MANRKVLINRHTSGSTAPNAAEMFHGELAVAHETGKETLWTKNNANEMVPFISCAQTISIIDGKIAEVNVVYDVKEGESEPHIEVATGQTGSSVTFTLTSKDIESEEEFKSYSARTNEALTALTAAMNALTDVVLTGVSGDTIIVATVNDPSTGSSNSVSLTHRTGEETSGFKKLTTDAYGHVTASTDVVTADIEALGFKTSADTEELINALSAGTIQLSSDTHNTIVKLSGDTEAAISKAIEDLGAVSATTGKYITAIGVNDGALVKEEADLPTLSVESAGTGNVVSRITVNGHEITYETASVATSEGIAELSAATINLSGAAVNNETNITNLSAGTIHDIETLSADTEAAIAQLSAGTIQLSADTKAAIDQLSAGTIQLSADTKAAIDELGSPRILNMVLLGAAIRTGEIGLTEDDIKKAMDRLIKPAFMEMNLKAFGFYQAR